jgi:hypothetical protein
MKLHPAVTPAMRRGQRVEVLLHRGWADEWEPGTVVDPESMTVQLDKEVPGLPLVVSETDIADWRPAPS